MPDFIDLVHRRLGSSRAIPPSQPWPAREIDLLLLSMPPHLSPSPHRPARRSKAAFDLRNRVRHQESTLFMEIPDKEELETCSDRRSSSPQATHRMRQILARDPDALLQTTSKLLDFCVVAAPAHIAALFFIFFILVAST
jgi:hypothetical protein